jgi:hypothetical protein
MDLLPVNPVLPDPARSILKVLMAMQWIKVVNLILHVRIHDNKAKYCIVRSVPILT